MSSYLSMKSNWILFRDLMRMKNTTYLFLLFWKLAFVLTTPTILFSSENCSLWITYWLASWQGSVLMEFSLKLRLDSSYGNCETKSLTLVAHSFRILSDKKKRDKLESSKWIYCNPLLSCTYLWGREWFFDWSIYW